VEPVSFRTLRYKYSIVVSQEQGANELFALVALSIACVYATGNRHVRHCGAALTVGTEKTQAGGTGVVLYIAKQKTPLIQISMTHLRDDAGFAIRLHERHLPQY
jgi:hypothetical protein